MTSIKQDLEDIRAGVERMTDHSLESGRLGRELGFLRGLNFATELLEHLHHEAAAKAVAEFLIADALRVEALAHLDHDQRQDFLANLKPEPTR